MGVGLCVCVDGGVVVVGVVGVGGSGLGGLFMWMMASRGLNGTTISQSSSSSSLKDRLRLVCASCSTPDPDPDPDPSPDPSSPTLPFRQSRLLPPTLFFSAVTGFLSGRTNSCITHPFDCISCIRNSKKLAVVITKECFKMSVSSASNAARSSISSSSSPPP